MQRLLDARARRHARDRRPPAASTDVPAGRRPHHRREVPGQRRVRRRTTGRTWSVLRPHRRGQVRHPGSRRLRVRARRRASSTTSPAAAAAVLFSPVHGVLDAQAAGRVDPRGSAAGPPAAAGAQVHLGRRDTRGLNSSSCSTVPADQRVQRMNAVLLLSGGLDSYTAGGDRASAEGYELYALTVRYGQVHAREIEAARRVATALGVARHLELDVDLAAFGGSALVGDGDIPKDRAARRRARSRPPTCRRATRCSCRWRWPGPKSSAPRRSSSASTRSTTPAIPTAGPSTSRRSSAWRRSPRRAGVEGRPLRILAPLLRLTKADIIRRGLALGLDYGLTHSCYDPGRTARPCGRCDSCRLRASGFERSRRRRSGRSRAHAGD